MQFDAANSTPLCTVRCRDPYNNVYVLNRFAAIKMCFVYVENAKL